MKYYKLMTVDEHAKEEDMFCISKNNFEKEYNFGRYELTEGKVIQNWNNEFIFSFNSNEGSKITDYLCNDLGWLLISPTFKEILVKLQVKNIQFLPVVIKDINNENFIIDGYNIINITSLTDALDLENSRYFDISTNNVKSISITKYALKSNKVKGLDILRLKDSSIPIFISERLKNEIIRNKLTGISLLEVKVI